MHLFVIYATAVCLPLLLAEAQGTASCSQTRPSDFPQATDVASLINSQALSVCSQLQAATSLPLSASFQGYGLRTNASSSSFDTGLCQNVLSGIAQSCVLNANYYGGLYFSQRQMFNLSNTIYPQNPILSGLGATQASDTTASAYSSGGIIGYATTQSQSSAGTTYFQPQNSWSSSPSTPSATPTVVSSNSASTVAVLSSSSSSMNLYQTSQTFQVSTATTGTLSGSPPLQMTSSGSQATEIGTASGLQSSTASITNQLASSSGSTVIPTLSATVSASAAGAIATQALSNASSTVADLKNNPDSQDAKQAALDAINAAEAAAIAWLLSALGPAVAEAELVAADTAPVSDLIAAWATVEAAEQMEEQDEEGQEEAESASLSIASQTPSTSQPLSSPMFSSSATVSASSTLTSAPSAVSGTCALYTYPSDDEIDEGPGEDDTGALTGTASKRRVRVRRLVQTLKRKAQTLGSNQGTCTGFEWKDEQLGPLLPASMDATFPTALVPPNQTT